MSDWGTRCSVRGVRVSGAGGGGGGASAATLRGKLRGFIVKLVDWLLLHAGWPAIRVNQAG